MSQTILAVESATDAVSAALFISGQVFCESKVAPRQQAETILPMIDRLLQQNACTLDHVDIIAYGMGPGSFMGVRLATAVAQGLAYGAGISIYPVSSLAALAYQHAQIGEKKPIVAGWDARLGQIYWGAYWVEDHRITVIQADQLSDPGAVLLDDQRPWQLVGNAWEIYPEVYSSLPRSLLCYPSAEAIAKIAAAQLLGAPLDQAYEAPIQYLRHNVAHKKNSTK